MKSNFNKVLFTGIIFLIICIIIGLFIFNSIKTDKHSEKIVIEHKNMVSEIHNEPNNSSVDTKIIEQKINNDIQEARKEIVNYIKIGVESKILDPLSDSFNDTFFDRYTKYILSDNEDKAIEMLEGQISSGEADPGIYYKLIDLLEMIKLSENREVDMIVLMTEELENYKKTGESNFRKVALLTDPAIYKKNALINKKITEKIKKYTKEAYKKFQKVPAIIYLASEYILPEKEAKEKLSIAIAKMNKNDILYELMDYQLNLLKKKKQTG